jgi:mono/diheme cytochrome c family protein
MSTPKTRLKALAAALLLTLAAAPCGLAADAPSLGNPTPDKPSLGKPIPEADIKGWNITILPDGTNLPPGSGTAAQGAPVFAQKCAGCHGEGAKGGSSRTLVGAPSLTEAGIEADKTIGNFWADPTTLFDYIRRAMPWPQPRTLSDEEVYSLCAYIFSLNKFIGENDTMDAQTLPKVKLPNRGNFIIKFPDQMPSRG